MEKRYNELNQELTSEIISVLNKKRINILNELLYFNQNECATSQQLYIIDEIIYRIEDTDSYFGHGIAEKLKRKPLTKDEIISKLLYASDEKLFDYEIEQDLEISIRDDVLNRFN